MRIIKLLILFFLFAIPSLLYLFMNTGCSSTPAEPSSPTAREPGSIAVTHWTARMELFMEYPPLIRGESNAFIIHLTQLKDFKPVTAGRVYLEFTPGTGPSFTVTENKLLREGIFKPMVTFSNPGTYKLSIRFQGEQLSDVFDIGTIHVYADWASIPNDSDAAGTVEEISFLKEQQWKVSFRTSPAKLMTIRPSLSAVAEVLPGARGQVDITAPVSGILSIPKDGTAALPGMTVKQGQVLAVLTPPPGGENSWAETRLAFDQAKKEYERAQRLIKQDAISLREYEASERRYLELEAGFPAQKKPGNGSQFAIVSPADGVVLSVQAVIGESVTRGRSLISIVNRDSVRLKINLFEKDYYRLVAPSGAAIHFPGLDTPVYLRAEEMRGLSKGEIVDERTGTIALVFEVDNKDGHFKIGQVLQTDLYIDKDKEALGVPVESVYDDDGRQVVFIQRGGETFEKRYVKTGYASFGWVEIVEGLKPGEHVVTQGTYLVKLAGTSTPIGHGHTH